MAGRTTKAAAKKKTAKKPAKVAKKEIAKKAAATRVAAKPTLLAGGNPQIATLSASSGV